jgi:hypothetical protein
LSPCLQPNTLDHARLQLLGLDLALPDLNRSKPGCIVEKDSERIAHGRNISCQQVERSARLLSWGLIDRQGRRYYIRAKTLNSLIGMRSYHQVRRILSKATQELTVLDTLPG